MTTFLAQKKLQHLNSIAHEGKIVVFATDTDGKISYTVKQDGFEDSYLKTPEDQRTGWEDSQTLEFPNEIKIDKDNNEVPAPDESVIQLEKAELTYQEEANKFIVRSCYNTKDKSAVAPVQLISALGHIYVFRQSKDNTLLVDRFVLDGMTNKLNRKLEVRFKRSKQKHTPTKNMKKGANGLENVDTLDFRDADGNFFYEPTTELCVVEKLDKGWFSVVLVPTIENDVYRWHIFAYNSLTEKVELTTIRASEEGLFNVKDYTVFDDVNDTLVPRSIPGIIKRTLEIKDHSDPTKDVTVSNGLAATKYDIQRERQTDDGMQLLRESTRVMLAIPTNQGNVAAISFAVAGDGTLSQIRKDPNQKTVVRSNSREILLPLNTLDEIKAIEDTAPPPQGLITGMERQNNDDKVLITTSSELSKLEAGAVVEIAGTRNYDGHYSVVKSDKNTFEIEAKWVQNDIGTWKVVPQKETGLVFDGMITAVKPTGNGKLQVTASNHGLANKDEVQIVDTTAYNSSYPITKIEGKGFTIDGILWKAGEAVNLKLEAEKRRGIVFNGKDDCIATSDDVLKAPSANEDFEATCSAWINNSSTGRGKQLIVGQNSASISLVIKQSGKVAFRVVTNGYLNEVEDPTSLPKDQWVHYAGVVKYDRQTKEITLRLCKNGVEVNPEDSPRDVTPLLEETQKLQAKEKEAKEWFGHSIAICGDRAIFNTLEINGREGNAYIFERKAEGTWEQVEKLIAIGQTGHEYFGGSVAISENTAIVGAPEANNTGTAYFFQRNATGTSAPVQKLQALDYNINDKFGSSVAISGNTAIVGAPEANNIGSAYIFERNETGTWVEVKKLQPLDLNANHQFGYSVAISEGTAIVGVPERSGRDYAGRGRAYIFKRNPSGEWEQVGKLQAEDFQAEDFQIVDQFGYSVAISENTAIVGTNQTTMSSYFRGSAYIFQRNREGQWEKVQKLQVHHSQVPDRFGYSVAISGDKAIVGAMFAHNIDKAGKGSAYIFKRNASGEWKEFQNLQAQDSQPKDNFGNSVAISGDTAIVGSYQQHTGGLIYAGSAYIFTSQKEQKEQKDLKFRIGESFVGKIADVQIWNKARTAQDIKNNMYLQLTGQEVGLVGYWRLGAILEEKERKVLDFSVNKNHGIVHGQAYVSAVTLKRQNQTTKYENEDLFAVSERATYEEEFEFKTNQGVNPDKADGNEGKIFAITVKGKKSRGSEDWTNIQISNEATTFTESKDDSKWYQAKLRFTVPDGVSLLRSFGINEFKGKWKSLEIRKHRIRLLSESITEAKYTDKVTLKTLADRQATLHQMLQELELEEKKEAKLLKKKLVLETITIPENLTTKLKTQEEKVKQLEKRKNELLENFQKEQNNIFNYWCKIKLANTSSRTNSAQTYLYASEGGTEYIGAPVSTWNDTCQWQFILQQGNRYKIKLSDNAGSKVRYRYLHAASGGNKTSGANVVTWKDGQDWELEHNEENGTYKIKLPKGKYPEVRYEYLHTSDKLTVVTWKDGDSWELIKANNTPCTHKMLLAKGAWYNANEDYKRELNSLRALEEAFQPSQTKQRQWANSLKVVNTDLDTTRKNLERLNTNFIQGVKTQQRPQTMDIVAKVKELVTQGALLGFVKPASRLNAIETCEGNVQLSYFDTDARMRQTKYDATADSNNTTFGEWIPDAKRVCLNLSKDNSKVLLQRDQNQPPSLNQEWSIEAWFFYPLPEDEDEDEDKEKGPLARHTLTEGKDGDCHIQVKNGNQLGIYLKNAPEGLNETFYDSGYDMDSLTPGWHHLTAVGLTGTTQFYINGEKVGDTKEKAVADAEQAVAAAEQSKDVAPVDAQEAKNKLERIRRAVLKVTSNICSIGNSATGKQQFGKLAEVRIWGIALSKEEIAVNSKTLLSGNEPGLLAYYPMNEAEGTTVHDHTRKGDNGTVSSGEIWWGCSAPIGKVVDCDGVNNDVDLVSLPEPKSPSTQPHENTRTIEILKRDTSVNKGDDLSEIRGAMQDSWQIPVDQGNDDFEEYGDLVRSFSFGIGTQQIRIPTANTKKQGEAITGEDNTPSQSPTLSGYISDALVSNEYSTVTIDPKTNRKVAIMRRFLGYPTAKGVKLLADKRVEELELKWIGNAQFAPTLLGYIEGAPPVPSENLTLSDDYNGATSVELTMSEDVAFSWNRGQDWGLGSSVETFLGFEKEISAGVAITTKIAEIRAGFKGHLNYSHQSQKESSISSSSSLMMTDKLELRGTPEKTAKFPHLGTRFIPKNVGYALVVSALADVFVTRLARSGKMVGYQVLPVEGIPPDVNTITFLLNPAYTMNGSLDGLTGSIPTSDRFFKHVPEMRSQYGSLYPASYYRLQEAYDLKKQIEAEDKRRESYFSNFDVNPLWGASSGNINSGDAPTAIGVQRPEDEPDTEMTDEEKKKAEEANSKRAQAEAKAAAENNRSATQQKQAEIQKKIADQEKQVQALSSLAGWQKRMEDIQIRANKRNIVNTYVWDADGGLRTEAQSFANTVEHTIGGSFTMDAAGGLEGNASFVVLAVELTAQNTINLTQTMSKTQSRSKGFQLNVELGDLEHKGITDHDDKPILPGEKVDRYRFMSFYLEGSSQNFHDFFNYVVDPEWLQSNSEGARALRDAQAGKPNKAWRVLHRVTYVERPALMGFGRDVRKLPAATAVSENQKLLEKIAKLEEKNQKLEDKLDTILNVLKEKK